MVEGHDLEKAQSPGDKMTAAANAIAEGLRSYEAAALASEEQKPDPELVQARSKLEAARKIVMDGRLGYALVRQLVEHTKYCPSWIKRQEFSSYIDFDATDITGEQKDTQDNGRRVETKIIRFQFEGKDYGCVFRDDGCSSAPDSQIQIW